MLALGTPEVGGLTTVQAVEIVRGCRGLNVIGGDIVEVYNYNIIVYAMACLGGLVEQC